MHILVYEFLTGGGLNGNPAASLIEEGEHMVLGLVRDLLKIPGHTVTLMRDIRLRPFPLNDPRLQLIWVSPNEEPMAHLLDALDVVDAVWPIAPETGGCLAALCQSVEAQGKRLLTTPREGVVLAASKGETLKRLQDLGVPVVPTYPIESLEFPKIWDYPWIFKIDDGVGCEDTIIIWGSDDLKRFKERQDQRVWLAQPFLEGEAMSLSGIFSQGEGRLLCCNHQNMLQRREGFSLLGITVSARPDPEGVFKTLLSQIARAIPSLWGYAGIDLILEPEGPKVLEINPRLTSAYPGISAATGFNPAALVLDLAQTHTLPSFAEPLPGSPVTLHWSTH